MVLLPQTFPVSPSRPAHSPEVNPSASSRSLRIAVVIPAFNSAALVGETILSVLRQTRPAAEIVVVDDGSVDDSAVVAAQVDSRVTVLRQNNRGMGAARQVGFQATTADLIMFLDTDDVLHATALKKLAEVLERDPDIALACARAEFWFPGEPVSTREDPLSWPENGSVWAGFLYGNCIRTPGCVLVRREALVLAGGWDSEPGLKGNEDWDLWLRLAEQEKFHRIPETLIKYRQHAGAYSRNKLIMFRGMQGVLKKQRQRHQNDDEKARLVADAEWNFCYQFNQMARLAIREHIAHGRWLAALKIGLEMIAITLRPFLIRVLTIPRRHWRK